MFQTLIFSGQHLSKLLTLDLVSKKVTELEINVDSMVLWV